MAISRLTGLVSGMDTEALVKQLVDARRAKMQKTTNSKTRLEWKQDAWKELNAKVVKFHSGSLSNMRYQGTFLANKVSSTSTAVSASAQNSAPVGNQTVKVEQLAQTAYMTGAKLSSNVQGSTNLVSDLGLTAGTTLSLHVGGTATQIEIKADSTVSSLVSSLRAAGLNANFDEGNKRFFLSAKESGAGGDFQLTASDADGLAALQALGLQYDSASGTGQAGLTYIKGQDARLTLNGAEFTSKSNEFSINGLSISANAVMAESATITVKRDTDSIYKSIQSFIKDYNEVINELDKRYNAESARSMDPLTDEQKESMSEKEVEAWEKKIKDSLLRRDENVRSASNLMQEAMSASYTIKGEKLSLRDFGIETAQYSVAKANERNAYHIGGDNEDSQATGIPEKLRSMLDQDPEKVMDFFNELGKSLYTSMDKAMSSSAYRSKLSLYDDKTMQTELNDYKAKIAEQEKKLAEYEDKWYKKFAAMEKAMAQLQSSTSAISGLLGGLQ